MKSSSSRLRPLPALLAAAAAALAAAGPAPAAAPAFPVTIKSANGAVTINARPTRIVSLSPTATDDLFAVGAGRQVVAVDSYSTYPKSAPTTNLSAYTPNVEAIAKYRPDLVVLAEDRNGVVAALAKLSIPALVEPAAASLADVYGEIRQLGQATGHTAEAATVVKRMRAKIASYVASVKRPSTPLTVYHELDPTYYSATSKTFIGTIYTLFGLKNVADGAKGASDYPQLSAEYIVSANPDLIVLADTVCCGQTPGKVGARAGWGTIAAVRTGSIAALDDSIASEWGTRIVQFAKAIATAVRRLEAKTA